MNGDRDLPKDSNIKDVSEGYDSISDDGLIVVIVLLKGPCVGCVKCRRWFQSHAKFLDHLVECLGIEKIKEHMAKRCRYHFRAPAQRGEVGPSAAPRLLNLFKDPLELKLAPLEPPLPPQPVNLDLTLAIGRNKPGGSQQHHGNHNGAGQGDGNAGKNFRM